MAVKTTKYSRKREAIRTLLSGTKTHPSAEWIYSKLKPEFPDLSFATVYRNLGEMKQNGEIASVAFFDGKEHFDGCTAPHAHFICDCCGDICDFDDDSALNDIAQKNFDGKITHHSLIFHGICKKCLT